MSSSWGLCTLYVTPVSWLGRLNCKDLLGCHICVMLISLSILSVFCDAQGHATPTAINVQTIATLQQNGEAEVSCILFWQYMGSIISLPLLLLMFFQLI